MKNGLNEKLTRIDAAVATIKHNLHFTENAVIEDVAESTSLKRLLNIYIQEDEPVNKDGLWIKTADTSINTEHVSIDENFYEAKTFLSAAERPAIGRDVDGINTCIVGNYMYCFGKVLASTQADTVYFKINLNTYEISNITNPKIPLLEHPTPVGKYIYIWQCYMNGSNSSWTPSTRYFMRYDTENDIWETLPEPFPLSVDYNPQSRPVVIGDEIYFMGFIKANPDTTMTPGYMNGRISVKFNTQTLQWIQLNDYPYWMRPQAPGIVLGDTIWFLFANVSTAASSNVPASYAYQRVIAYDITKDEYIYPNILISGMSSYSAPMLFTDDENIYFTNSSYKNELFVAPLSVLKVYDKQYTFTPSSTNKIQDKVNSYKEIYGANRPVAMWYQNKIYFTGYGYSSFPYFLKEMAMDSKTYEQNTLIIKQGHDRETSVPVRMVSIPLDFGELHTLVQRVAYYNVDSGLNTLLDVYYGNGTSWNKLN